MNDARFIVVAVNGDDAAGCIILADPANRHRSDMPLHWVQAFRLGIRGECVVRCAPEMIRMAGQQERIGKVALVVADQVASFVAREMQIQAREDGWRSDRER
ncbi:hypothetical protein [Asaia krungthepensis]|uniref:hypothetical protein n=1 Tax=Asaia krungthepensis TaxID=220990 RepID=UPI0022305BCC|nr:hypothetical protein [Asaia krungthepensis]